MTGAADSGEAGLPAGAGLERQQVASAFYFSPKLQHVYIHNHKAACSTVKNSLLANIYGRDSGLIDDSSLHQRRSGPFSNFIFRNDPETIGIAAALPFFTVVRNPYTRILSGYLSKIRRDDPVGRRFYDRFFLDKESSQPLNFRDFLTCVVTEHPRRLDGHFRHQYVNTMYPHTPFEFVGAVEDIGKLAAYFASYHTALTSWVDHATNAASLLERYYDDAALKDVREAFADDFRFFGYPGRMDQATAPPALPAAPGPAGTACSIRDYLVAADAVPQPGTHEIELWQSYRAAASADHARRAEIASAALAMNDWHYVHSFAHAVLVDDDFELARRLMDHALLLRTRHMDDLPERLLSERGLALKRQRDAILSRR